MATALSPALQCLPHGTHFVLHPSTDHQPSVGTRAKHPQDVFTESVYRLIPAEVARSKRAPRYHSQHAGAVRQEYHQNQRSAATMGPLKVAQATTSEFLKRGESDARRQQLAHEAQSSKSRSASPSSKGQSRATTIPPVEKSSEFLVRRQQDYVHGNVHEIAGSHPPAAPSSGPVYREKADYGKTPEYIHSHKADLADRHAHEQELQEQAERDRVAATGMTLLSEEERVKVLDGLKQNWEGLNREYGKLSLVVDTLPKITRKINLEKQLQQLEADIQTFSHQNVYIKTSQ